MKLRQPSLTATGLVIALLLLIATTAASVFNVRTYVERTNRITQTYEGLRSLKSIYGYLAAAEAAQRGYLISGDTSYTVPYTEALEALTLELNILAEQLADTDRQKARRAELSILVERRLTLLDEGMNLRATETFAAAQAQVRSNAGRVVSDQIRSLIIAMEAEELTLLADARAASRATAVYTLAFILLGTLTSLWLLLAVYLALRREIRERRQTQGALVRETAFLHALMDTLPDTIFFKDTASRFTRINRSQAALLGLVDPRQAVGKTDHDFLAPEAAERVVAEERAMLSTGKALIDRVEAAPTPDGQPRYFSTTKLPLLDTEGEVVGLVGISRDITRRVETEAEVQQANDRLSQSFAALERQNARMVLLNEMLDLLATCDSSAEAFEIIARSAAQLVPAEVGVLYILNASRNLLEVGVSWGTERLAAEEELLQPNDCWSVRRSRPHHVRPGQTEAVCRHVAASGGEGYLCVPLAAQGETLGMVHVRRLAAGPGDAGAVGDEPYRLVQVLADHLSMALANLRLREKLKVQAIRDPLTGLFNRRYFEEALDRELTRADRRGTPLAVIMLDLDHFKQFNDSFGHAAGDVLLRTLGDCLRKSVRGEDIACRYGGEEFVLVLADATLGQARSRAQDLLQTVGRLTIDYRGQALGAVTVSMGLALFPTHGRLAGDLLRAADAALYQAKAQGRNRVVEAAERVSETPVV